MHYNAFISYRHGGRDGLVAEKLHKMLETYRIPKKIAEKTGKKRIERVFRDREELPTSSNLSNSIEYALENSEYLILICSKRTCQSMWVMREVDLFSKMHGRDKIVALLIDGEPDESFPDTIRYEIRDGESVPIEPLAADIRAKTDRQSIKILKSEKLRLLAPILNCAYDDLKQRHRERKIKRAVTGAAVAFAGVTAFGTFSFVQYLEIQKQMQLKLEQQSYVLSEYSNTALQSGDVVTAALLAMEALPDNLQNPERPFVAAAEKALSDAMRYYHLTDGFDYHRAIAMSSAASKVMLSPDERYTAVIHPYYLEIIDSASGDSIQKLATPVSSLADAEFLSNDVVVYSAAEGITAFDLASGTVLWNRTDAVGSITISEDKSTIAALSENGSTVHFYNAAGDKTNTIELREQHIGFDPTFLNPHNTIFELSQNGGQLIVSYADGRLALIAKDGSVQLLDTADGGEFCGGFYLGEYFVYSKICYRPYKTTLTIINTAGAGVYVRYESPTHHFAPAYDSKDQIGFYYGNGTNLVYVDMNYVEPHRQVVTTFSDNIEAVSAEGGRLIVTTSNNGVYIYDKTTAPLVKGNEGIAYPLPNGGQLTTFSTDYVGNFLDIGTQYAVVGSYDSYNAVLFKNKDYSDKEIIANDRKMSYIDSGIMDDSSHISRYSYKGFVTYTASGEEIMRIEFPNSDDIENMLFDKATGNIAAVTPTGLSIYDNKSGKVLYEITDCKSVFWTGDDDFHCLKGTTVSRISFQKAEVTASKETSANASFGLLLGETVQSDFSERDVLAVYDMGSDYYMVLSYGNVVEIYSVTGDEVILSFKIEVTGRAEARFLNGGKHLAIIPYNGIPSIYDVISRQKVAELSQEGYLSDIYNCGDYIVGDFISSTLERYSLLLDKETFHATAEVKGLCDITADSDLLINDGKGNLRKISIHSLSQLVSEANEMFGGRELTSEQKWQYHIG